MAVKKKTMTKAEPAHSATNWEAQDALHTLKRAHQIKNDPKLMHHVREHAKQERAAITKVIGRGKK
jgi:hypothetical protein